ncbi:MAG: nucleotidyltransferase family protein [Saprospiraceae bacterium]|nr:nucleotidyltransferase family protein [Saprospiraceae bacterium]
MLAAGASTRMGQPKQLLSWQGETLIHRAVQTALATKCKSVILVLGAYANEIHQEIGKFEISITENPNWQEGMSTSVKMGLETLLSANPNVRGALFMLSDQPLLISAHLERLMDEFFQQQAASNKPQVASIIASFYNEKASVPALFDRKWFEQLMQLKGDQGARALLQTYSDEIQAIPLPEGAFDLDTPEDYEQLIKNIKY